VIKNALFCAVCIGLSLPVSAEINWVSSTLDNDLFVGNDNGYTNGIYVSFIETGLAAKRIPSHDFWVAPLMWSMPDHDIIMALNAYTIGQTMNTSSDITVAVPDKNELPYSALLALTNNYVVVTPHYADQVSTSVGIVGPAALGEDAQKFVHKLIEADEPKGWDTQLKNELVFQFSRGRTWRTWVSAADDADILTSANLSLGTLQSLVNTGVTLRYGRDLHNSYATGLLSSSRTANLSAVEGGWFVYAGLNAGYIFNQIFTNGNTFRDSRSIDYSHEFIGATAGIAYSWEGYSITFGVNNANLLQSGSNQEALSELTEYGTLTFSMRL